MNNMIYNVNVIVLCTLVVLFHRESMSTRRSMPSKSSTSSSVTASEEGNTCTFISIDRLSTQGHTSVIDVLSTQGHMACSEISHFGRSEGKEWWTRAIVLERKTY